MPKALVLMMAGFAIGSPHPGWGVAQAQVTATTSVSRAQAAGAFRFAPLKLGALSGQRYFEAFSISKAAPSSVLVSAGRPGPDTRTTCTMRVLEPEPTLDARILAPAPRGDVDPRMRGSVSPCLR